MGLTEAQKIAVLEEAVLFRTPEEIAEIYKRLGELKYTARALGFACHYRGLDVVKALVDCGAELSGDFVREFDSLDQCDRELLELRHSRLNQDFSAALMNASPLLFNTGFYNYGKSAGLESIPFNERLKILEYFRENAKRINFDIESFISRVLTYGPEFAYYFRGRISDRMAYMINSDNFDKWDGFYTMTDGLPDDEYIPCLTEVILKTGGKKLFYSGITCMDCTERRFKIPGMYEFFFENFVIPEENRLVTAEYIITSGTTAVFELAERYGWFEDPEFVNKLIQESARTHSVEFTAWLLDCKNRKFGVDAERGAMNKKISLNDENSDQDQN